MKIKFEGMFLAIFFCWGIETKNDKFDVVSILFMPVLISKSDVDGFFD
jgi:hypothetical protein